MLLAAVITNHSSQRMKEKHDQNYFDNVNKLDCLDTQSFKTLTK